VLTTPQLVAEQQRVSSKIRKRDAERQPEPAPKTPSL
jgi:hypothetical protein